MHTCTDLLESSFFILYFFSSVAVAFSEQSRVSWILAEGISLHEGR